MVSLVTRTQEEVTIRSEATQVMILFKEALATIFLMEEMVPMQFSANLVMIPYTEAQVMTCFMETT